MLNLSRPLCFVDFESTGVDPQKDRIIQYSFCKIFPNGQREIKTGYFDPEMPIPAEATKIHEITDADVAGKPKFREQAVGLYNFIKDCDLGGFNSNRFDFPLLYAEFCRSGKVDWDYSNVKFIDAGNIYVVKEPRTLQAAYKFYTGQELTGAHDAENDILATVDVFLGQIQRYEDLPNTIDELDTFCNFGKKRLDMTNKFVMHEDGQTILLNFGEHKGKPAKGQSGFLSWMLFGKHAPFPPDAIKIAKEIYDSIPFK